MFSLNNNGFILQTNTQISVTGKLVWNNATAVMTPGTHTRPNNQNPSNIISLEITFPSCGVQPLKINDTTSKLVRTKQITFDQSMELREGDLSAGGALEELSYGVDANGNLTTIDIHLETTTMILGVSKKVFLRLSCGDVDNENCGLIKVGAYDSDPLGIVDLVNNPGLSFASIMLQRMNSSYLLFSGDFNMVSYCIPKFIALFYKKGASSAPPATNTEFVTSLYWYPNFNSGRNGALGMDLDFATTTPPPTESLSDPNPSPMIDPTFEDDSNVIDNNVSQIGSFQIVPLDAFLSSVPQLAQLFPQTDFGCGGQILQSIDVKIGEQKLFTEDIAQPAPLEEHLGVMPNQRIYITAQDPRYFEISINSVAEPECTSTTKGAGPEFLRDRKIAKMGRSVVMSSQRSTLRSQLRKMGTLGFQATKGKLSAGSYKKDVVIRRKPKTLRAGGSDYIQLKKWRALSHGKSVKPGTDTIPNSRNFLLNMAENDGCILL